MGYNDEIPQDITDSLCELGYDLYELPFNGPMDGGLLLSNVPLTEGWLFKNYQKFDLKLRGWVPEDKDAELELRTW